MTNISWDFLNRELGDRLNLYFFEEMDSTNKFAFSLGKANSLVVAVSQRSGKGRLGRRWISPKGGLWFSLTVQPPQRNISLLPLCVGFSLSKVLERITSLNVMFHWPNDIYVNGKKLGGVLIESRILGHTSPFVVIGIGINGNFYVSHLQGDFHVPPTSLKEETKKDWDLNYLLKELVLEVLKYLKQLNNFSASYLVDVYKKKCVTLGHIVKVTEGNGENYKALAMDLSPEGFLLIKNLKTKEEKFLNSVERITLD